MPNKNRKLPKLPKKILALGNADKDSWQERWYPGRDLLNFPCGSRIVLVGPPNSGKSNAIRNILLRADPPYERVMVYQYDPDSTEWDDIEPEYLDEMPDPLQIKNDGVKKFLILEDLELSQLKGPNLAKMNRLFGYCASHNQLTIAICAQNAIDIPTCARRVANVFVLWRSPDIIAMTQLASRTGLRQNDLWNIFDKFDGTKGIKDHSSLWVDITWNTLAKLRIDGYKVLRKKGQKDLKEEECK